MLITIPLLGDFLRDRLKLQCLDDAVDRLNYFATTVVLLFFAFMVGTKQHFGSPIECMAPPEFKETWIAYVRDYCFIQGTYTHPISEDLSMHHDNEPNINYYQWVPFFLAFQAFLFYLPNWVWSSYLEQSGNDIETVVAEAKNVQSTLGEERQKKVGELAEFIEKYVGRRRGLGGLGLCIGYVLLKIVYLSNVALQFVLMSLFLDTGYTFWGFELFYDLLKGLETPHSGIFPRTTMCDVSKMENANVHRYSVQCVIMLNMLNEKIFLFLWFWMITVGVLTLLSLIYTAFVLASCGCRVRKTRHFLTAALGDGKDDHFWRLEITRFYNQILGTDGLLTLNFVESHAGTVIAQEVTAYLWEKFMEMEQKLGRFGNGALHENGILLPMFDQPPISRGHRHNASGPVAFSGVGHSLRKDDSLPIDTDATLPLRKTSSLEDAKSNRDEGFYDRFTDPNSVTASAMNVTLADGKDKASVNLDSSTPRKAVPVKIQSLV